MQMNAALFVDFDNIYISLAQLDSMVANKFATNPDRWLSWLERDMPAICEGSSGASRRILIRKCYLNPQAFGDFRPYFIRSAFEVVDCPPLTTRGKTSTDIRMVMDILDALDHATHFDEFIILSGDADFTPVLLRLRMFNRYSAVLSAGYASPAYKASCDHLIAQDIFLRDALGIAASDEEASSQVEGTGDVPESVLIKLAARLYEAAVPPNGIEASQLPGVYLEFPEFRQSNHWLGFYTLRRLTEALVEKRSDLKIVEEDPWRVARVSYAPSVTASRPVLSGEQIAAAEKEQQDIRKAIAEWITSIVGESERPVTMAVLAQGVNARFGEYPVESDWLGAGTFKHLLTQLDLGNLQLLSTSPGYVYDPSRHETSAAALACTPSDLTHPATAEPVDMFSVKYPELALLARKIHQLTDTPYLVPEHYALLLRELAREINERGYQMTRTSKTVRDRCVEKGAPVARSHVNFVLIGIGYSGHRFGQDLPESAETLAEALVQNTINLCRTAQLNLSDEERTEIRTWLAGSIASEASSPSEGAAD